MLFGRKTLKTLCMDYVPNFYQPAVLRALPESIECLFLATVTNFYPFQPSYDECLAIIGSLPNLRELSLDVGQATEKNVEFDWLKLLPAAAQLAQLALMNFDTAFQDVHMLLPTMKNLKDVDLIFVSGNCDDLLRALSFLPSLRSLVISGSGFLTSDSESSLSRIADGLVRRSLGICSIKLTVDYEHVRIALLQCFHAPFDLLASEKMSPSGICELVLDLRNILLY
mmetsp:Transcript_882/g.2561  ORF Transcript_882/g.2561 Transcript_882/m.2561 type:complete len:226 (+) Transcript_882:213-890(+)